MGSASQARRITEDDRQAMIRFVKQHYKGLLSMNQWAEKRKRGNIRREEEAPRLTSQGEAEGAGYRPY